MRISSSGMGTCRLLAKCGRPGLEVQPSLSSPSSLRRASFLWRHCPPCQRSIDVSYTQVKIVRCCEIMIYKRKREGSSCPQRVYILAWSQNTQKKHKKKNFFEAEAIVSTNRWQTLRLITEESLEWRSCSRKRSWCLLSICYKPPRWSYLTLSPVLWGRIDHLDFIEEEIEAPNNYMSCPMSHD